MKKLNYIFLFTLMLLNISAFSQKIILENAKRKFSKSEIRFMSTRLDSIKFNLNRMIIFEKELMQRNYYLNEKTALVDELVSIVEQLKKSLDVVDVQISDIKKVFGKPSFKSAKILSYEIETYKSNCPFIQITFYIQETAVTKLDYKITDCQRWR